MTMIRRLLKTLQTAMFRGNPLRDKSGKSQRGARLFGSRPGGANNPEARPVEPKVPGTTDQPRRRRLTTDPSILRGRQRKAALKRKPKSLRGVFA